MSISEQTILRAAGIGADTGLASVVAVRGNIMGMSQKAEDAVLRPKETGAFSHALRAALAARVAGRAKDQELADYYAEAAGEYADLVRLDATGGAQGLEAVVTFVDRVANQTRDIAQEDIKALQQAGVCDPDIVRLCELVAFLAYQIRVVSGLRLMKGDGQ